MDKGIAEINVSDSDELRLKKINENFKNIVLGATPVGSVSTSGGGYVRMATAVGGTIATNPMFASTLSNYLITAQYITAEKIGTEELLAEYARIDFLNAGDLFVQNFWTQNANVDNLTANKASIANMLKAVKITSDMIVANTIMADRIMLSNGQTTNLDAFINSTQGLFKLINEQILGDKDDLRAQINKMVNDPDSDLDMPTVLQYYDNGIDGTGIVVGTIDATKITVEDISAFKATIGGLTISDPNGPDGGRITARTDRGLLELRNTGYFRAGGITGAYIEVDPVAERVNVNCTTMRTEEDIVIKDAWKWDYVPTGTSAGTLNLVYIGQ